MASQYIQKYPIPNSFQEILHDFIREVLRIQPKDILQFACHYFEKLNEFQIETNKHVKVYKELSQKEISQKELSQKELSQKDLSQNSSNLVKEANEYAQNIYKSALDLDTSHDKSVEIDPLERIAKSSVIEMENKLMNEKKIVQNENSKKEEELKKKKLEEEKKKLEEEKKKKEAENILEGPLEEYEDVAKLIQSKWKKNKGKLPAVKK